MQPDLTVSRTYTSPMCFQDSIDKELMAEHALLDPLPDLQVKGQTAEKRHKRAFILKGFQTMRVGQRQCNYPDLQR